MGHLSLWGSIGRAVGPSEEASTGAAPGVGEGPVTLPANSRRLAGRATCRGPKPALRPAGAEGPTPGRLAPLLHHRPHPVPHVGTTTWGPPGAGSARGLAARRGRRREGARASCLLTTEWMW